MKWPHALLVVAAALMLATCASGGSTVSTAARPPSAVDGRFLWQDLVTTNATAARAFYSALLGWEFAETTRGGRPYLIARTAAGPVGGLVDIRDIKDAGSQWVAYVAVADINRPVGEVQALVGESSCRRPPRQRGVPPSWSIHKGPPSGCCRRRGRRRQAGSTW